METLIFPNQKILQQLKTNRKTEILEIVEI